MSMHHRVYTTPFCKVEVPRSSNLTRSKWSCVLSTQQVKALLTFLWKPFSFFPKVLVHYQPQAYIHLWMKLTTHFALHSQEVWISTCMQYIWNYQWQTGVSPLLLLCSKKHSSKPPLVMQLCSTCKGFKPHLPDWTHSHSFAKTSEILFGLNSSAYLYD